MDIISAGNTILVDDFANERINDGLTECSAVIARALLASGRGTAQLGPGTYLIDPTALVTVGAAQTLCGAGMGATKIKLQSSKTGIGIRLNTRATLADLTIEGNDEANTTCAAPVSGGSTAGVVCSRVRFKDCNNGTSDNGIVTGWSFYGCEWESNLTNDFVTNSASKNINFFGGRMASSSTNGINLTSSPVGVGIYGVDFEGQTTGVNLSSPTGCVVDGCRFNCTTSIGVGTVVRCAIGENTYASDEILPSDVTNKSCTLRGKYYGTASPSAGTWLTGDVVHNSTPGTSKLTAVAWQCSTGGTSGTWQAVYRGVGLLTGTATWDPGSLNDGQSETKQVTVTGAVVGDLAIATHDQNLPSGMLLTAQAIGSDLVDVVLSNVGAGTQNVASGTVTVMVLRP